MTEHDEQVAVFEWARRNLGSYPMLAWMFAVPNGGKLPYGTSPTGYHYSPKRLVLVKEGMLAGVSDIFLPFAVHPYHGLFVEMKAGKRDATPEQDSFIWAVRSYGYAAVVCRGFDQARLTIERYLNGEYEQRDSTIYAA